jgi:YgiT-type zinc finger domain-containing protein
MLYIITTYITNTLRFLNDYRTEESEMNNYTISAHSPFCNGQKQAGHALYLVDMGFGVVVVRHVPATICSQCGSEWFADLVAT